MVITSQRLLHTGRGAPLKTCADLDLPFIASAALRGTAPAVMVRGPVFQRKGRAASRPGHRPGDVAQWCLGVATAAQSGQDQTEGVLFIDAATGAIERASAQLVVLCASTIETIRLLLLSRDDHQSGGLIDPQGLLGLGLMDHVSVARFFALPAQPLLQPAPVYRGQKVASFPTPVRATGSGGRATV